MQVVDELYGCFEIEPVLDKLISCDAVQRLKKVHQGGATFLVNPLWSGNRYDHSVGVMLLIKQLGGSVEEQILGLLHDVSHTAFSHVIDYVLEDQSEEFHEKIYEAVVITSEIPKILNQYDYECETILKMNSYRLEAPLPFLCADRIDYTLRDLYSCGYVSLKEIQSFIENLSFVDNKIVIRSLEWTEWFTKAYYHEVIDFFMHPLNVYANHQMAQLLKEALNTNIIHLDDFKQDEEVLLNQIKRSGSQHLIQALDQINGQVHLIEDEANYTIYRKLKPRMVDPLVYVNDEIKPVSELSTTSHKLITTALQKLQHGIYLRVESK